MPPQMNNPLFAHASTAPAPLWRRFAAMAYDALLVVALWFVAAVPVTVAFHPQLGDTLARWGMRVYLFAVGFAFFGWFWTHGGQTLGMRAWRVRLVQRDDAPLTWRVALVRYVLASVSLAAGGLGYWWSLIDRERLTWHDRIARTRMKVVTALSDPAQQVPGEPKE